MFFQRGYLQWVATRQLPPPQFPAHSFYHAFNSVMFPKIQVSLFTTHCISLSEYSSPHIHMETVNKGNSWHCYILWLLKKQEQVASILLRYASLINQSLVLMYLPSQQGNLFHFYFRWVALLAAAAVLFLSASRSNTCFIPPALLLKNLWFICVSEAQGESNEVVSWSTRCVYFVRPDRPKFFTCITCVRRGGEKLWYE